MQSEVPEDLPEPGNKLAFWSGFVFFDSSVNEVAVLMKLCDFVVEPLYRTENCEWRDFRNGISIALT